MSDNNTASVTTDVENTNLSASAEAALSEIATVLKGEDSNTKKEYDDVMVDRSGNRITIPEGMTYAQARVWLERKEEEEEAES